MKQGPSFNKSSGRCLITGASGYIGGCIKQTLESAGWEVTELGRSATLSASAIRFRLGQPVSPTQLRGFSALVHCAYDFTKFRWNDICAVNIRGSELLLRAAAEANVEHVVFISTISAFEGCPSLYGRGKLEVERIAHSLGAWVIRPGLVHDNRTGGMFGRLVQNVGRSRILPIPGKGHQEMYLVHRLDLAEAALRCVQGGYPFSAAPITVAHGQPSPFRSILLGIARALDRKIILMPVPWRAVWAGLCMAEILNLPVGFHSDNLISLIHQNSHPVLNAEEVLGVRCRSFQPVLTPAPS
jgi:nucleoside-diphosphate-sugar epimerase